MIGHGQVHPPPHTSGMFSLKIAWMRIGGSAGAGAALRDRDQPVDRIAGLDPRVLVDHRVERAGDEQAAGVLGQLVADEGDLAGPARFLERAGDAAVAGADIVEAGEAGIGGEQRLRLAIGALGVVADLAQLDAPSARDIPRRGCGGSPSRAPRGRDS